MKNLFILFAVLVAGCSTYDGSFECPVGSGMVCSSLSRINKSMDQGKIDLDTQEDPKTPSVYIAPLLSQKLKG
jgi:hypothetical protein